MGQIDERICEMLVKQNAEQDHSETIGYGTQKTDMF